MSFSRFSRAVLPCVTALFMASAAQAVDVVIPQHHRSVGVDQNGQVVLAVAADKNGTEFKSLLDIHDPSAVFWGCRDIFEMNRQIMLLAIGRGYTALIADKITRDIDAAVLFGVRQCALRGVAP